MEIKIMDIWMMINSSCSCSAVGLVNGSEEVKAVVKSDWGNLRVSYLRT